MNIIVFGCDNSGKTVLSKHISEKFGFEYVQSLYKKDPNATFEEVYDYLLKHVTSPNNYVFDRFSFIEERIYGPVLRNSYDHLLSPTELKSFWFPQIDYFIYARPKKKTITNWTEIEQLDGVKENVDRLIFEYDEFVKRFMRPYKRKGRFIRYNWTKDSDFSAIDDLLKERLSL